MEDLKMGFFSDLKEDLSQAVNELIPEDGADAKEAEAETASGVEAQEEEVQEPQTVNNFHADLSAMLDHVDDAEPEAEEEEEEVYVAPVVPEKPVFEQRTTNRVANDEVSVIMESMIINGNIATEGALDIRGSIVGDVEALGKLNITGTIQGNSRATEVFAEGAKITGEIRSNGAIKVGQSSVIIGDIYATSAVIAGAIKGDIDVKGPVILDASAIVMGNIKSKSVQINNGAVIEGMCSQCYAEVNPTSFFEELKKM